MFYSLSLLHPHLLYRSQLFLTFQASPQFEVSELWIKIHLTDPEKCVPLLDKCSLKQGLDILRSLHLGTTEFFYVDYFVGSF